MKKSILNNSRKLDPIDLNPSSAPQKRLGSSQSVTTMPTKLPKVQFNEQESQKPAVGDEYVEKLHGHITFLNKTVRDMKKKQEEYKTGMVDMLSRDAKALPDLATDSQAKYKEMKQALLSQINALDNQQARAANKNIGLLKKKEKYQTLLEELEIKHSQIELEGKQRIIEIKEKFKKEKEHREELEGEVEKWLSQQQKFSQDYEARVKEISEKKFLEELASKRYQEEKELEEADEGNKKIEFSNHEKKLKELIDRQEEDFLYQSLKQKNSELSEQLRASAEEYENQRYQTTQYDTWIKMGELEKEKEAEERKKLRDEYDKQSSILEEYKRKNIEKVEKLFDTVVCPALIEAQKKLNKIKRQSKEMNDKFVQNETNYKKLSAEQMRKTYQLEQTKIRVKEKKTILSQLTQELNEREAELLEMTTRINEHELAMTRMKKDEDKLSKANQRLIIEQESLEVKVDNYEKTVQLQEIVQEVDLGELEKTHHSNLQFIDSLKNLKNLKEEVRTQSYE